MSEHMKTQRTPHFSPTTLVAAILGFLLQAVGVYWDIAWHIEVGRDRLFSAPHNMILAGMALVGVASTRVIATSPPKSVQRAAGFLGLGGVVIQIVGLAIVDDWWHRLYGIDATLWSPPHLLTLFASFVALCGFLMGWSTNTPRVGPRLAWATRFFGCLSLLVLADVLLAEYDFSVPQFRLAMQPVALSAALIGPLVFAKFYLRTPMAATSVALGFTVIRLGGWMVLAMLGRSSRPYFPAALVPALVVDVFLTPANKKGSPREFANRSAGFEKSARAIGEPNKAPPIPTVPPGGVVVASVTAAMCLLAVESGWEAVLQKSFGLPPPSAQLHAYMVGALPALVAVVPTGLIAVTLARHLSVASVAGDVGSTGAEGHRGVEQCQLPGNASQDRQRLFPRAKGAPLVSVLLLAIGTVFAWGAWSDPASAHDPTVSDPHGRWAKVSEGVYQAPFSGTATRPYALAVVGPRREGSSTALLLSTASGTSPSKDAWLYGFMSRRCPAEERRSGACERLGVRQADTTYRAGTFGVAYVWSVGAFVLNVEWPAPGEYFGVLRLLDGNHLMAAELHVHVPASGVPQPPADADGQTLVNGSLLRTATPIELGILGRSVPPDTGRPRPPSWLKPSAYLALVIMIVAGVVLVRAVPTLHARWSSGTAAGERAGRSDRSASTTYKRRVFSDG